MGDLSHEAAIGPSVPKPVGWARVFSGLAGPRQRKEFLVPSVLVGDAHNVVLGEVTADLNLD